MKNPCFTLAALLAAFLTPATAADFISTWNGSTGNWSDSTKWTTPGAPAGTFPNNGASTFDAVQNGGTLTVDLVGGITIQNLSLGGGTLSTSQPLNLNGTMALSGGTLGGTGTLTAAGKLTWTGGVIGNSNTGTAVVQANGGVDFTGGNQKFLTGSTVSGGPTLRLAGISEWKGGALALDRGAALLIQTGAELRTDFDGSINGGGARNNGTITNQGAITKTAGAGGASATVINSFGTLTNTGTVNVNAGTIQFNSAGTHTNAVFNAVSGTVLRFSGNTHTFSGSSVFNGAGELRLDGATVSVSSSNTVTVNTPVSLVAGTLGGNGTATVAGRITWTGGVIGDSSSGTAMVQANGGVDFTGGNQKLLTGSATSGGPTLRLAGISEWKGGALALDRGATLLIQTGAELRTDFDGSINGGGAVNNGTITNQGAITKTAGAGGASATVINSFGTLTNTGTVNVNAGTIQFNSAGTHTDAVFNALSGTVLRFSGNTHTFSGSSVFNGAGELRLDGATVSVPAAEAITVNVPLVISSGNLGTAGTINVSAPMTWTGGRIGGGSSQSMVLNANAGMTISGSNLKEFTNSNNGGLPVLRLDGNSSWTGGNITVGRGASIVNLAGRIFDTNFDGSLLDATGGLRFENHGIFRKSGVSTPVSQTTIGIPFDHKPGSTCQLDAGTLDLLGGGTYEGAFTGAVGTTVRFGGGVANFNAGTFSAAAVLIDKTPNYGAPRANFNIPASISTLTIKGDAGSTLGGTGTVTVSGRMTFETGAIRDDGGILQADGGVDFITPGAKSLQGSADASTNGHKLRLGGNSTWSAGALNLASAAEIEIRSGATLDNSFDGAITHSTGAIWSNLTNNGTLVKSGGNSTETTIGVTLVNNGEIRVETGTLKFNNHPSFQSTHSATATLNAAVGTTVRFTGCDMRFPSGSGYTAAGTTVIEGGTVHFNNAATTASLTMTSGVLDGAGTLTVSGAMTFSGGNLNGSGTVIANGGVTFTTGSNKSIGGSAHKLTMGGNSEWNAGKIYVQSGSIVTNLAGGTFTTTFDGTMEQTTGAATSFINAGTFTKSATGGGSTVIFPAFSNTGTVNANSGTIQFINPYTQAAGALVLNGGNVSRGNSTNAFTITGGKIQGGGTLTGAVTSVGGTVHIEPGIGTTTGTLAISGDLTLTSGSKLSFDLGGIAPGTGHDQLTEAGGSALSVSGVTLEVNMLNGFIPAVGERVTVVEASTSEITGSFANVTNGARLTLPGGLVSCQVNYGSATAFPADNGNRKVILSHFATTPSSLTLDDNQVIENAPFGTVVGLLSATDPDPSATFTFSLVAGAGDTGNGQFQISGNQLQAKAGLDFETQTSYSIRLRVTNNSGGFLEQQFTIQVQDVPKPSTLALSATSISESLPVHTVIGQLSATDPTPGATFGFALVSGTGDTDNVRFNLDGTDLRSSEIFDFETTPGPFSIRLRVTNNGGESLEQPFSITVQNQGPTALALSPSSILEGRPVGATVGTLSSTVMPDGTSVTYELVSGTGATHNAQFQIVGTALKTAVVPDFAAGATRSIRVRATGPATETMDQVFSITVINAGPPTDIALSASSIPENQPINTVVGTLSATDPDSEATFNFALVDTATFPDNNRFNLSGPGGTSLRTSQPFDVEAPLVADRGPFNIRVRVTNGANEFYDETLTITVTDIPSPTDIALSATSIPENQPLNTIVGTLSATDSDPEASFTFEFVDRPNQPSHFFLFNISGATLRSSQIFDFEHPELRGPYFVRVRVTNNDSGEFYDEDFTITVSDQGPTNIALTPSTILEGQFTGTLVGTLSATVVPEGTIVHFEFDDGPGDEDNQLFDMNTSDGIVTRSVFDHEVSPTRSIRIKADDVLGEAFEQVITINIADMAVTDITLSGTTVLENLPAGAVIGNLGALVNPADPGNPTTFSVVSSTPSSAVTVNFDNQLVTARPLQRSTEPTIAVRLRAMHLGETYEEDVTITVNENTAGLVIEDQLGAPLTAASLGDVVVGSGQIGNRPVVLRNTGPGHVFNISIRNPAAPNNDFHAESHVLEADADLAPGETVPVSLAFVPNALGDRNAAIVFESDNAPDKSLSVTGRGIGPEISVQHPLGTELVDGAALDFGRQPVGVSFPARSFIVKNAGVVSSLDSIAASLTGPDAAFFVLDTQGLSTSLAEGASSSFRVTFQPNTVRAYNATLSITSSDLDENPFDIPLTAEGVTPLMIGQTAYAKASDTGAGDLFGRSVAVSGNTVVVGAPFEDGPDGTLPDSGGVYVFVRDPVTGAWSEQAKLRASNPSAGDQFGISVAISGDTLVVGAPNEDSNTTDINSTPNESAGNAGAAYVFVRSGTTWSQQAYLKASNADAGDSFGTSVGISGDTIVVGADREASAATGVNGDGGNNGAAAAGAAYVFQRSGGVWSQAAYLKASNTGSGDSFGTSVSISGDTIVVGADGEDSTATGVNGNGGNNGAIQAGAAYVFQRSGGVWSQEAYLKASNPGGGDLFGVSVGISADTIVVGAHVEDSTATGVNGNGGNNGAMQAGAAYVFQRSSGVWSQEAYLKASNTGSGDLFGISVAISGEAIIVGAAGESSTAAGVNGDGGNDGAISAGAAYVFRRGGGVWSQEAYLKASNTEAGDSFGTSVGISGDIIVVGAQVEDSAATGVNGDSGNNGAQQSGAAYIFGTMAPEVIVHNGSDTGSPRLTDSQAQAVDYGTTQINVPVTRAFTIHNLRALPLTVHSIAAPAPGFTVLSAPAGPVPAQGTATFFVRLNATASGSFSGNVTINTNDGANPQFIFPVSGEVPVVISEGTLDPSFGTGGIVRIDFSGGNDGAFDMVRFDDGRIAIGGFGANRPALARLLANGALDPTFSQDGRLPLDAFPTGQATVALGIQSGQLIALHGDFGERFGVDGRPLSITRHLHDGSLDPSFDVQGTDSIGEDTLPSSADASSMLVLASGKIVLSGSSIHGGSVHKAFVLRGTQNGKLDTGFTIFIGEEGFATEDWVGDMRALPDGSLIAAGRFGFNLGLIRIAANGGVIGGQLLPRPDLVGVGDRVPTVTEMAQQSSGKIVFCGRGADHFAPGSALFGDGFFTGRLNPDLTLDTNFGTNGFAIQSGTLGRIEQAFSVAVDQQDRVLVAGHDDNDWIVVRYLPNGTPDMTFGVNGVSRLALGAFGIARKILVLPDGSILVAGHSSNGSNADMVVVRLLGSPVNSAMTVRNGTVSTSPVITDGQATVVQFGLPRVGAALTKSFLIENSGTAPLTINGVTVPSGYQITSNPGSIAAGSSGTLGIQLLATTLGNFSGTVIITTNDPANGAFTFPINGQVVANKPPVYSPLTLETLEGRPVTVTFDKLVRQVTDANRDAVAISSFSEFSVLGARITQAEKALTFTQPVPLAGTDTFKVTFSDGVAQVTGVVTVLVGTDPGLNPKNPPKARTLPDGRKEIKFSGIANETYSIQQTTDGVNFIQIGTAKADSRGAVIFVTAGVPPANAAFRIREL